MQNLKQTIGKMIIDLFFSTLIADIAADVASGEGPYSEYVAEKLAELDA